jgi:hypothetical protein
MTILGGTPACRAAEDPQKAVPLVNRSGSPFGSVAVEQVDSGLVIAGTVADATAVEVSLADGQPPSFPPVGWGHQFGYETLNVEADCEKSQAGDARSAKDRAACVSWFREQLAYRGVLSRLFGRRWRIDSDTVEETYARPAFDRMGAKARADLAPLEPRVKPEAKSRARAGAADGFTFELRIPWEAFPPLRSLDVREVRIGIRPLNRAPASEPPPFVSYQLPRPRRFTITPCGFGLDESTVIFTARNRDYLRPSEHAVVYFVPSHDPDVRQTIVLDNPAAGYQYNPGPDARSPIPLVARFWTRDTGDGVVVCGPSLAILHAGAVTRSTFVIDAADRIQLKTLDTGDVLMKDGPRAWGSYYGSGQCGACPRVGVDVYYLDKSSGTISPAIQHAGISEADSNEEDITVSADWSTIEILDGTTTYKNDQPVTIWKATTHCYRANRRVYEPCGQRENIGPPARRSIDLDQVFR